MADEAAVEVPQPVMNPDWKPIGDAITPLLNHRDSALIYIVRLEEALMLERRKTKDLDEELHLALQRLGEE